MPSSPTGAAGANRDAAPPGREDRLMPDTEIVVRDCRPGDLAAVQAIYAHHVLHGLASFEEVPPDLEQIRERHARVLAHGLP